MKVLAVFFSFLLSYSPLAAFDLYQGMENRYYDWADKYKKKSPYKAKESSSKSYKASSKYVNEVFEDLISKFQRLQKSCSSRNTCLKEEKKVLVSKGQTLGQRHPSYRTIQNVLTIMGKQSKSDLFVTSLYLYKNMSKEARKDFNAGIRIQPLTKESSYKNYSRSSRYYVLDDILNLAIQKVVKNRKNCQERDYCLRKDKEILSNLAQQLDSSDPAYKSLKRIMKNLEAEADKQIYDGAALLKMYQKKGDREGSYASFVSKEEQEWEKLNKSYSRKVEKKARTVGYAQSPTKSYSSYKSYPSYKEDSSSRYSKPKYYDDYDDDSYYSSPSRKYYNSEQRYREEPSRVYREKPSRAYREEKSRKQREDSSRKYWEEKSRGFLEEPARKAENAFKSYLNKLFDF